MKIYYSPRQEEMKNLSTAFDRRFSDVIKGMKEPFNYWCASAFFLSSDAFLIERSSVVHYVDNPVQNAHRRHRKYSPQGLYKKCNHGAVNAGWGDEVPFDIAPWPIPEIPTPPWIELVWRDGAVILIVRTSSTTASIITRGVIWLWFYGQGPWEGREREKVRRVVSYNNGNLGRIAVHIDGWMDYPEEGDKVVEHRIEKIRGGAAYGHEMVRVSELGPGTLHGTVGLVRRWKDMKDLQILPGTKIPPFFERYPTSKMAPLPYDVYSNPAVVDINKDSERSDLETRKKIEEIVKRKKAKSR